jgi:hypothetical protein
MFAEHLLRLIWRDETEAISATRRLILFDAQGRQKVVATVRATAGAGDNRRRGHFNHLDIQ